MYARMPVSVFLYHPGVPKHSHVSAPRSSAEVARIIAWYRAIDVTAPRIKAYIAKRQADRAPNGTVNRELTTLKRMFALAARQTPPKVGQVPYVPMLEEHNVRSGFFEHEDFLALRGALPDYAQVAVTLAYYSSMRMGEVFSLSWSQVNFGTGRLYLKAQDTKTNAPRTLTMPEDLRRVLLAAAL